MRLAWGDDAPEHPTTPLLARKPADADEARAEAHRIARERWARCWRNGSGAPSGRIAGAFLHCYGDEARTKANAAWLLGLLDDRMARALDHALEVAGVPEAMPMLAGIEAAARRGGAL